MTEAPPAEPAADPVTVVGEPRALPGTRYGQRQPVLVAMLHASCPPHLDLDHLQREIAGLVELPSPPPPEDSGRDGTLAAIAQRLAVALLRWSGHAVFDAGATLPGTVAGRPRHMAVVPYDDAGAASAALRMAVRVVNSLATGERSADVRMAESLGRFREATRTRASGASNTLHMLTAADELGIPWSRLTGFVYQIGHGARARWFDSTITDATPRLGTAFVQNKHTTAELLRRSGLPAPQHAVAEDVDDAAAIAGRLGYPVVLKPLDLDGGIGVAAGLADEPALRAAFPATAAHGRPVLVEKHAEGEDFRLIVIGGRTAWVITRLAGGITGDGDATVAELLRRLNADPRRGDGLHSPLKSIDWDEEAMMLVAEQDLTADAVPAAGRFVRLRRSANVATGGMPVPAMDRTHPDNLRLAERAARVFGLDLAGIDFITPDIGRSWLEVGGIINEVNAQPNVGVITARHLFGEMLTWMLGGTDGRIPIAAITGGDEGTRTAVAVLAHAALRAAGLRAGLATHDGAWVGDERVSALDMRGHRGGSVLLADRAVEAAVIDMPGRGIATWGLPFDRCDVTLLLPGVEDRSGEEELAARARRKVIVAADDPRLADRAAGTERVLLTGPGRDHPRLAAHRARGGEAAWIDGARAIAIGRGGAAVARLELERPADVVSLAAAALAHAMGCPPAAIARALASAGVSSAYR
ncbi:MAG: cyanophycin synthetase [Alphaproteobacteria bacterium]